MFGKKEESNHSVYLKVRVASSVVSKFSGERMLPEDIPTIKSSTQLNSYDSAIQKAEASLVPGNRDLWFHHGPSTFASSPNMTIDIGEPVDQLKLEIVGDWITVETTYSEICLFYAPIKALKALIDVGHLGYVGIHGVEREIEGPAGLNWIEPINEKVGGGMTNKDQNGITATYTNEAIQLIINKVFDGGEHPQIFDK
jgi:hypothetical protein